MHHLGPISVGNSKPVRIMGILNTSPESFYKKSIKRSASSIRDTISTMQSQGADIIDVGGMSTAPYLSTLISEELEFQRIENAIKIIQNVSNLPISVDTCRASVARKALQLGIDAINDISGLKYDKQMAKVISDFDSSAILSASSNNFTKFANISSVSKLLESSIKIAKSNQMDLNKIIVDPAIGFFRKTGKNPFFTKISSNWVSRDLSALRDIKFIKKGFPTLISASNKSFIGKILSKTNPADRLAGSLAAETLAVICGASIIRTHNVRETRRVILMAQGISSIHKSL